MSSVSDEYCPSDENVRQACDPNEYGDDKKYPYIRYLPFTRPSMEARKDLAKLYNAKNKNVDLSKIDLDIIKKGAISDAASKYKPHFPDPNICSIEKETINDVLCHWIKYKGSSINNGVIICCHGGAYICCDSTHNIPFTALISSLTGYVCICIDYKLAPQYKLPYCVNEVIDVYDYLINKLNISSKKIGMVGESAGGGLILLALQSIKYGKQSHRNLDLPCCAWIISPWTDLGETLTHKTFERNAKYDPQVAPDTLRFMAKLATENEKQMNSDQVSPLLGEFKGLCPLYFMVGATEILLDDTLLCADKAYKTGINVKVDIHPYMNHIWVVKVPFHQEAVYATVRGCEWLTKYVKIDKNDNDNKDNIESKEEETDTAIIKKSLKELAVILESKEVNAKFNFCILINKISSLSFEKGGILYDKLKESQSASIYETIIQFISQSQ